MGCTVAVQQQRQAHSRPGPKQKWVQAPDRRSKHLRPSRLALPRFRWLPRRQRTPRVPSPISDPNALRYALRVGCHDPVNERQHFADALIGDRVNHGLAASLRRDEAAPLQAREVVAHAALRHVEIDHEFANG